MNPIVSPTDGWDRGPPTDDELVPLALVVRGLGLAQLHLVQVEPEAVHQVRGDHCVGVSKQSSSLVKPN